MNNKSVLEIKSLNNYYKNNFPKKTGLLNGQVQDSEDAGRWDLWERGEGGEQVDE
jgi:hypothetical protein